MFCGTPLVVDADPATLELVSALLARIGFEPHSVGTGAEALAADEPQLVVLDVCMPDMSGYEILRELRERYGVGLPIMFLSGERTESYDRVGGLLLGADDYMVKPFDPDELMARARALMRSRPALRLAPVVVESDESLLTVREREVLELLASGLKQETIAERLVISPKTVSTHIQRVLMKLGVHSRAQAVAEAYRRGFVSDTDTELHALTPPQRLAPA